MYTGYVTKRCPQCSENRPVTDIYCNKCGTELLSPKPKVYGGVHADAAVYRVTFTIEYEFRNNDHLNEWCGKTRLGDEAEEAPDYFGATKLRSLCTKKTHPYVCSECEDIYSDSDEVWCEWCDTKAWRKR